MPLSRDDFIALFDNSHASLVGLQQRVDGLRLSVNDAIDLRRWLLECNHVLRNLNEHLYNYILSLTPAPTAPPPPEPIPPPPEPTPLDVLQVIQDNPQVIYTVLYNWIHANAELRGTEIAALLVKLQAQPEQPLVPR